MNWKEINYWKVMFKIYGLFNIKMTIELFNWMFKIIFLSE